MQNSIYDNRVELRLTGSGTTNAYATFTVESARRVNPGDPTTYPVIYTGKTWIDGNGDTTVYLGEIMKDFAFAVWEEYVSGEQSYRVPSGEWRVNSQLGDQNCIFNSLVRVKFQNAEYPLLTADVSPLRTLIPSTQALTAPIPYNNEPWVVYSGAENGVVPRLPAVNTDKCLYSTLLSTNYQVFNLFEGVNQYALCNATWLGSLFIVFNMSELYTNLPGISGVNDTTIYVERVGSPSTYVETAVVEVCTKPYYLQWFDANNIFHSWGMVKNGAITADGSNATTYTDINTGKSVLETNPTNSWTLNTGNISKAEYYDLLTAFSARVMYLYDVDLDMRFKVFPSVKSGQWVERSRSLQHNFNITLNEVII